MTVALQTDIHTDGKEIKNSIALIVALISFSMLFATLFLGYTVFRLTSEVWPPAGMPRVPLFLPTLSTLFVVLSSVFAFFTESSFLKREGKKVKSFYLLTISTGLLFIVCQFKFWSFLKSIGVLTKSGIYPSMIYAFTWIHTAHMVLASLAMLYLGFYFAKRAWVLSEKIDESNVNSVLKFWHFLAVVWLIMYALLFVL